MPQVTPRQLFGAFLLLGVSGFGGVMPLARHALVERRGWLDEASFAELLGLCQFLPGGNVVNLSVAVGHRFAGWRGGFAALAGLVAAPAMLVVVLGAAYGRFGTVPFVAHALGGIAAAAAGLLLALALQLLRPVARRLPGVVVAAGVALGVWLAPLPAVLAVGLPVSMLAMRRR